MRLASSILAVAAVAAFAVPTFAAGQRTTSADHFNPGAPSVASPTLAVESGSLTLPTVAESATVSGLNTTMRNLPRTQQQYINSAQLSSITSPVFITGIQFRLALGENWRPAGYVGASWPNVAINFPAYNITLGAATTSLDSDGEYLTSANSFAATQTGATAVRSGPLSITAGAFLADGGTSGVHSWGPVIDFDTDYVYTPGTSLVTTFSLQGYTGGAAQAFFASTGYAADAQDAIFASTFGATNSTGWNDVVIVNYLTAPIPEPATLGALAAVGLVALRRRK